MTNPDDVVGAHVMQERARKRDHVAMRIHIAVRDPHGRIPGATESPVETSACDGAGAMLCIGRRSRIRSNWLSAEVEARSGARRSVACTAITSDRNRTRISACTE